METMIQEKRKDLTEQLTSMTKAVYHQNVLASGRRKLNIDDIYVILSSVSALKRYEGKLLLYDIETGLYNEPRLVIRQYLIIIFKEVKDNYTMNMINKLIMYLTDDSKRNKDDNTIKTLISPPKDTYLFTNGWFNIKNGEKVDLVNSNNKEYARLNIRPYRYLPIDEVDNNDLSIAKQILDEWSCYDNDRLTQIKQVLYSVIQGKHRKRVVIIQGNDDSKSAFMTLAESLVGHNQVARVNLDEFHNDTILNAVKPRTMLISGRELLQNVRLSPTSNQRLNLFMSNEPMSINVKYQPEGRVIQSSAVVIQATNQLPKSFNDNPAIHNKLLIIPCPSSSSIEKVNDIPIEAMVNYILATTDDFEDYHIIKPMIDDKSPETSSIAHFIAYLKGLGAFNMKWFIPSLMYPIYLNWLKQVHIVTQPITQRRFSSQLLKQLRDNNLIDNKDEATTKRLKYATLNEWDPNVFLNESDPTTSHNNSFKVAFDKGKPVRVYQITHNNHVI